jgi:capsular polysaccharide biosynthesis protein
MNEQTLNLHKSVQGVRRHRTLVTTVTVICLCLGAAFSVVKPRVLTSTALVVIPAAVASADSIAGAESSTTGSGPDAYMATEIVIAASDPVLDGALPDVSPAMSLQTLRSIIKIDSPSSGIISVSAKGHTAAQAEAAANAVANSYTSYLGSDSDPGGHVVAHVLDVATTATGTAPVKQLAIDALLGAILGSLIGVAAALAINRSDRRLRDRDEIALSIGVPVLASFPVDHPADAAGWTKLFDEYKPSDVDAWRQRTALRQLGMTGFNGAGDSGGSSLAVLSLASDPGAFALGPQLAVFAASLGIPTTLVIGPQQDADITATLRTACAVPPPASSKRSSQLRVTVSEDNHVNVNGQAAGGLTVVVAVVDASNPRAASTMGAAATVLGVSAGAATADQLARAASSVAANGGEVAGILVADPEPADHTTGRIPQPVRPAQPKPPSRPAVANGAITEIRR